MKAYPLPAISGVESLDWMLDRNVALLESPLGRTVQRVGRSGDRWVTNLRFPLFVDNEAGVLSSWLEKASRPDSWLYLSPPQNRVRGNWAPAELLTNGTFRDETTTGWTAEAGTSLSINARRLKVTQTGAAAAAVYQNIATEAGKPHVLMADVVNGTLDPSDANGFFALSIYDSAGSTLEAALFVADDGRGVMPFYPSGSTSRVRLNTRGDGAGYAYVSHLSAVRCLTVNGGGQTGNALNVDGGPASTDAAIRAGEFVTLRVGNRWQMVRLVDDFDTDSSGAGTLRFEPQLRGYPVDGQPVIVRNPFVRMRLNQQPNQISAPKFHGFIASCVEDVTEVAGEIQSELLWAWEAETLSLAPSLGSGTMTLTRNDANGSFFAANGLLAFAAANVERFEYNPITRGLKGLLLEPPRTNSVLHNNDHTNGVWDNATYPVTVTANQVTGPDGTVSMDVIAATAANTRHLSKQTISGAAAGNIYTAMAVVDDYGGSYAVLGDGGDATWLMASFDLVNGTVRAANTGVTARIFPLSGTRYLCCATFTRTNTGTFQIAVGPDQQSATVVSGTSVGSFAGAGESVLSSNVQLIAGPLPSALINTGAATVSRLGDAVSILLSSLGVTDTSSLGVLVEFQVDAMETSTNVARQMLSIDDGTANERHIMRIEAGGAALIAYTQDGGVTQAAPSGGTVSAGTVHRFFYGMEANNFALSAGGGAPVTDVSGSMPAPTTLRLSGDSGGNLQPQAHLRRVHLFKRKPPNQFIKAYSA